MHGLNALQLVAGIVGDDSAVHSLSGLCTRPLWSPSSPFDIVAARIRRSLSQLRLESSLSAVTVVIGAAQVHVALRQGRCDSRGRRRPSVRTASRPTGPQIALAQNQRFYSVAVMASGDAIDAAVRAAPFPHHRTVANATGAAAAEQRRRKSKAPARGFRTKKNPSNRNKSRFRRQRLISRLLNGSTGSFFGEARTCSGAGWYIVIVYKLRRLKHFVDRDRWIWIFDIDSSTILIGQVSDKCKTSQTVSSQNVSTENKHRVLPLPQKKSK